MANFSATTANTRLHPIRDYSEHEVINWFSKDVTGVAGELVKIIRSTPDSTNAFSNATNGASFARVTNLRYEVTDKVKATVGGETKYAILGFTLNATLNTDENGIPLNILPNRKTELQCVISGEAVPVLRRGPVGLYSSAYVGTPTIGWAVVPHSGGNGKVAFVDPTQTGSLGSRGIAGVDYFTDQVIGSCISQSGSFNNGYCIVNVEL